MSWLDLTFFGVGMVIALAASLRGYPRMLLHAFWHPNCAH